MWGCVMTMISCTSVWSVGMCGDVGVCERGYV